MSNGIYSILSSKPHNPHYLNRYITFIEQCQQKNVGHEGYVERHHICPKALFPEYEDFRQHPWNCSVLTARQHFIAHVILERVFDSSKTKDALFFMSNNKWKRYNRYSKRYERLRIELLPKWIENGRQLGNTTNGQTVVKDKDGNTFRVSVDDSRIKAGELVGIMKNMTTVLDKNGNTLSVPVDDPRLLSGKLKGIAHGKTAVKDKKGKISQVSVDDPRLKTGELKHINAGMMPVKDEEGNRLQVSVDDPRLKTGELVSSTTGETVVKDKDGNRLRVSVDDPRLKTGELVGIAEGTITVRDKEGNCFRVDKNDPRYLSGELVGSTKGVPAHIKGHICYTDGKKDIYLKETETPPLGFQKGSLRNGKKIYNNGIIEMKFFEGEEPKGFVKGTLFKKVWATDGVVSIQVLINEIPEGFVRGRASRTKTPLPCR